MARKSTTTSTDRNLTAPEAAEWLGVATHTLANWRSTGKGPRFIRDGRYVAYPMSELCRYRDAHLVAPRGE